MILDTYVIMPNHMHGILHIISLGNDKNKSFQNTVGTGLVPVLNNIKETMGNGCNDCDETILHISNDGDIPLKNDDNTNVSIDENGDVKDCTFCDATSHPDRTESDRMGTRPIPTPYIYLICVNSNRFSVLI
ncbi:hypothetical protein JXQ70_16335 [bacterium]|nr:hypothetical protein [bacterium]